MCRFETTIKATIQEQSSSQTKNNRIRALYVRARKGGWGEVAVAFFNRLFIETNLHKVQFHKIKKVCFMVEEILPWSTFLCFRPKLKTYNTRRKNLDISPERTENLFLLLSRHNK